MHLSELQVLQVPLYCSKFWFWWVTYWLCSRSALFLADALNSCCLLSFQTGCYSFEMIHMYWRCREGKEEYVKAIRRDKSWPRSVYKNQCRRHIGMLLIWQQIWVVSFHEEYVNLEKMPQKREQKLFKSMQWKWLN